MVDLPENMSPEERKYIAGLAKTFKPVDGITSKTGQTNLQSLSSEDVQNINDVETEMDDESEQPDLQLEDENDQDESQVSQQQPDINDIKKLDKRTPEQQLQEGDVSKFNKPDIYEQPAASEPQPGGPALKTKSQKPGSELGDKAKQQIGQEAKSAVRQTGKAVTDAAAQAAKQAAQAVAKWAVQVGTKIIAATAEYWLPILLGVIGVVIIVIAIVFLVRALQTPNFNGSSPVQAADVINDKPWISKILALAGDKDIDNKMTAENLTGLLADLATLEGEINSGGYDTTVKTNGLVKISEIKQLINSFQSLLANDSNRVTTAQQMVANLSQLIDLFAVAPFKFTGETEYPIEKSSVDRFTGTLHCGTYLRPENCDNHRTFRQFMKGTADAVDIYAPLKTPINSVFTGEVIDKGSDSIQIQTKDSEGKKFIAVYAHMTNIRFSVGNTVAKGEQIGELRKLNKTAAHLHFELYCNERAVVTTKEDLTNFHSSSKRFDSIGEYLYVRILSSLNLTP